MFALWMFGKILENIWGQKSLIYYMITGIGAAAIHLIFCQYQIINISNQIPDLVNIAIEGKYNPSIPLKETNSTYNNSYSWASGVLDYYLL